MSLLSVACVAMCKVAKISDEMAIPSRFKDEFSQLQPEYNNPPKDQLSMDAVTGALCFVIASICSSLIYFILRQHNVKEDSFDKAKAIRQQTLIQSRLENTKAQNKKIKRSNKKVKEKKEVMESADVEPFQEQLRKEESKKSLTAKNTDNESCLEHVEEVVIEVTSLSAPPSSVMLASAQHTASVPQAVPSKVSKKKRTHITLNQIRNEKEAVSVSLLISLIQEAEISRSEIQMLIDALLNKQQEPVSEWLKGRQDPLVKVKKQLADTEQALNDEKEVNVGLQSKLKGMRSELVAERGRVRKIDEQLTNLNAELTNQNHKWRSLADEKQTLANRLQQVQQQLSEEQLKVKQRDDQLVQLRLTEETSHQGVMALQSQVGQLSAELQDKVRIIEEFQNMQNDLQRAYKELQTEIKTKERALSEINGEMEQIVAKNKHLYQQNEQLSTQVKTQCQEIVALREKIEAQAKLVAENWENGFSYSNNQDHFAEIETRLEEKSKQVEDMGKELELNRNKLDELNLSLAMNKSKHRNTQTLLELANEEIKCLKECLKESLKSRNPDKQTITELQNKVADQDRDIEALRLELDVCKERNDSLQHKNWKMAEALTNAEKALQTKIKQNSVESNKLNLGKMQATLLRLVKTMSPHCSLDENQCDIDKCLSYLEQAILSQAINGANDTTKSSLELLQENNRLQALVVNYKGIIVDTDNLLNQVQTRIELEEDKWKSKVRSLEEELNQLRQNQ